MLKTARYAAVPHAIARNHKIPIEVIEALAEERDQCALDGKRCMFEVFVVSHSENPKPLPPVILEPRSGGEVRIGKKAAPEYPESFSAGEFIVVQITLL